MRKIVLLLLLSLTLPLAATEVSKMATFFPVPYVAYGNVNTTILDIGLHTGAAKLNLGNTNLPSTRYPFSKDSNTAATITVESGQLNLATKSTPTGTLGNPKYVTFGGNVVLGTDSDIGQATFSNLLIGSTSSAASANAVTIRTRVLYLFGKKFPSCKAKAGGTTGIISWQQLQLAGSTSSDWYLVCTAGS